MKVRLEQMTFGVQTPLVSAISKNFRPLEWPPNPDWPVVLDAAGSVVSKWSDSTWDLSLWSGARRILNFGDGALSKDGQVIDLGNAHILRLIATWLIWGPNAAGSPATVSASFSRFRNLVMHCSKRGISAGDIMRFPIILRELANVIPASKYEEMLSELYRLYDSRELLGFVLLDPIGIRDMSRRAPHHDVVQTAYIPPRIWLYQVRRLRECIDEFLNNLDSISRCFKSCLEAYQINFGTLEAALVPRKDAKRAPFNSASQCIDGCVYQGKFSEFAQHHGVAELVRKWVEWEDADISISCFSAYLSLVTYASLMYIANFTLQRKEEVGSLRANCLIREKDEGFGVITIIRGETTKTVQDCDARWIASPSVEVAVKAASSIAAMRMQCDKVNRRVNPSEADVANPYLSSAATEPWGRGVGMAKPYAIRQPLLDAQKAFGRYGLLFDSDSFRIGDDDLELALRLTPNLPSSIFSVGKRWPLRWHQYRRTGAVNMFASGDISDRSIQQLLKHCSRLMPIYYGRNHSRLTFNREVAAAVMNEMYAQHALTAVPLITDRFVSPFSEERKQSLLTRLLALSDVKELSRLSKQGKISFRLHRLGACMKGGACEYGGIESVAQCAGGTDRKPCQDVLYDKAKAPQIRADIKRIGHELELIPNSSARFFALSEEKQAMENFIDATV